MIQITKGRTYIRAMILCALFAALIVIGTLIRIPFYPVPFTLQALFVTMSALLLGPKKGAVSVCLYILLGIVGLPVFAGGSGGPGYVLTPTFGYVLGFVAGAVVTGILAGKQAKISFLRALAAGLAGVVVIYTLGTIYGYLILHLYMGKDTGLWYMVWNFCIVFLPGDLLKGLLAALLAKTVRPAVMKM